MTRVSRNIHIKVKFLCCVNQPDIANGDIANRYIFLELFVDDDVMTWKLFPHYWLCDKTSDHRWST